MRFLIDVKIKSNKQITSLNINNQIETNPKTISEAFNKFFSTIAKDIDSTIIPTNKTDKDYLNASIVNSFFLNPINDEEAESLIKEMYTSKSVGPYSIPINTLKFSCSSPVKTSSQANWTCSKNIGNDVNIAKITKTEL